MRRRPLTIALLALLAAALITGGRYAHDGLQVATGYAAKLMCSLTLVSGQKPEAVQVELLDRVLYPVSRRLEMKPADCCASASAFGLAGARAVFRRGRGCTLLSGRQESEIFALGELPPRPVLDADVAWPLGGGGAEGEAAETAEVVAAIDAAIDQAFREVDPPASGRIRQTKAVLVVHRGRLVAERYADGYDASTPMISWSMAKSVTGALVGIAVEDGLLSLEGPAPVPEWSDPADPRHAITVDQLLRMSSGLAFDETYGAVNDVSKMLFTEPDAAAYAAAMPPAAPPDGAWSYSSGTTNILARALRTSLGGNPTEFVRFAREHLFDPAGMTTAFFEHDASGTPVGSSFVFMTARDWARFGELHLRDGVVDEERILPEGWVKYGTTPTPKAPGGRYGAHWWLNAGDPGDSSTRQWPGLPADAYAARGYAGQWVLVVPSAELVVVRLGISRPDDGEEGTTDLAATVLEAVGKGS